MKIVSIEQEGFTLTYEVVTSSGGHFASAFRCDPEFGHAVASLPKLYEALRKARSDLSEIGAHCACGYGCANCLRVEEAAGRITETLEGIP